MIVNLRLRLQIETERMKSTAPQLAVRTKPRTFGWVDAVVMAVVLGLLGCSQETDLFVRQQRSSADLAIVTP
jgi:hypothetical protein